MSPDIVPMGAAHGEGQDVAPFEITSPELVKTPETDEEAEAVGVSENATFWSRQISAALVHERRFRMEAQNAERLYFGEEQDAGQIDSSDAPKMNRITDETSFIHANIDVLKPLVFSETPTPIIARRWRGDGRADETDLMAAEAGQRLAQWFVSTSDFDSTMESARDDWLIAGRGMARALYKAEFGPVQQVNPVTMEPEIQEVKLHEEVLLRHVEWRRALFAPGHNFANAPWLAFETPMTRVRAQARFSKEVFAQIRFTQPGIKDASQAPGDREREGHTLGGLVDRSTELNTDPFDVATVWEIWVRDSRRVIWWSPDAQGIILDKQDDPLQLEGFFPGPKPLLATVRGSSLTPRPDISYYAERAKEIDRASKKMADLLDVLAVAGLFPGSMSDQVKKLMSGENQLIPMESWIALMEKGGTANLIQWLPLQPIVTCLNALATMREQAKQAMYEASGISDIMRAQGDPNETATAQQLKGRYAGMRLSIRQRQMATFARDILRIMMEIALEMFDTERLAEICGLEIPLTEAERQQQLAEIEQAKQTFMQQAQIYGEMQKAAQGAQAQGLQVGPLPPPPEEPKFDRVPETSWEMVHDRLRQDFIRKITLSIETDSTVLADEQADKEARIEFLGAFSTFVRELQPLLASGQFDMKMVKELLLFGVRAFPKSRTLEGMISQMPDEPKGEQKEDVQVQVAKIRAEADRLIKEMDMDDSEKDRQMELKIKGVDLIKAAALEHAKPSGPSPQLPAH